MSEKTPSKVLTRSQRQVLLDSNLEFALTKKKLNMSLHCDTNVPQSSREGHESKPMPKLADKMATPGMAQQSTCASKTTIRTKKSTSSSIARRKQLELEAAEAKARIQMELIEKKLEADLAKVDRDSEKASRVGTDVSPDEVLGAYCSSLPSEKRVHDNVEKWLDTHCPSPVQHDNSIQQLAHTLKDLMNQSTSCAKHEDKLLSRLAMPRELPVFSGDSIEWLHFKSAYDDSSLVCRFSDSENQWRLRKSLRGEAKEAVTDLLIGNTPPSAVMEALELRFGRPDIIVSNITMQLRKLPSLPTHYQHDLITLSVKVNNCVATIRALNQNDYLRSPELAAAIVSKLPSTLIGRWTEFAYNRLRDGRSRLEVLAAFLKLEADMISVVGCTQPREKKPEAPAPPKRAVNTSAVDASDDCKFCQKGNHILIKCRAFKRAMRKDKWRFVKTRGLCYCCLQKRHNKDTTCPAPVCDIDECGKSHHRLLHWTKPEMTPPSADKAPLTPEPTLPAPDMPVLHFARDSDDVESCVSADPEEFALLKVIAVQLRGPKGVVNTHALLDDGAQVSVIDAELADSLGLKCSSAQPIRFTDAFGLSVYQSEVPSVRVEITGQDITSYDYGEPIKLPENLESLPRAEHFAAQRHRWNTNEEIAAILINFDKHCEWQSKEVKIRPKSGSMLLYSRKKVRYRRDGYCWKKRKDGKTTREDHMKLKVQGTECIYGCYVHSAILPTFHRRCYWLLQNPDIVLVHYLNVPYPDDNKLATVAPSLALWADKKEWTKEELVSQLKPMFFSEDAPDINSDLEISGKMFQTAETVEAIVGQLMEKQRAARAAALARQLECSCPDSTCQDSRTCTHALRRVQAKQPPSDHQVSSTTGPSPRPIAHPPRQYTRDHRPTQQTSSPLLLSLGQIQGGGGLLILNGTSSAQSHSSIVSPLSVTSFICEEPRDRFRHQYKPTFVLKRELPEATCIKKIEPLEIENTVQENKIEMDFNRKIKMEPKSRTHFIASAPVTPSRYPDLVERLESEVLTKNCDDTLVLLGTDSHLATGFFDETLELSHEDIQKTLSANMPNCDLRNGVRSTETANVMVSGIDTMDFIESCEAVASPTHVVDDNVFVNLDAFDMLGDFPELEVLDPNTISTNPVTIYETTQKPPTPVITNAVEKMQTDCVPEPDQRTLNITDYSPEWAYPEGGAKVLIAGPWTECSDQYTVLFDNFPVPSILVQNGLLRCYCPAHEAGLAALQVARGGRVVSDTVVFEYKVGPAPAPPSPASAPLPSLDFRRFSLLQRIQRLHGRLQVKIEPMDENSQIEDSQLYTNPKFEERLVSFCMSLSARSLGTSEGFTTEPGEDASTILHLAAALGFTKLTIALLRWRQDDCSLALEKEVNLGARDVDNNTPLMVASAAGNVETAVVLARWSAGTRTEAGARQAAAAARRAGHNHLANMLDRIHPPMTKDGVFLRPNSLSQKGRAGSLESNLVKRPSIDSGINMADAFRSNSAIDKADGSSSARWERSMSLPLDSDTSEDSFGDSKTGRRMDLALCQTDRRAPSPLIDVEALSEPPSPPPPPPPPPPGEQDDRVFTLAEQIIAAMPERIKNESSSLLGCGLDAGGSSGEDTLMTPLLDDTTNFNTEFSFEFCDNTYRYCGGSTPCSSGSVSPGSALSPPPPSPRSALTSSSSTLSATLQEFLNATTHFSSLTLNDREQRELYSAAITIQKAYRQYRGRQLQRRAAAAAITIQNCYRRYKQFAYLKQMHAAATVIQRGYRTMRARRMVTNNPVKRTYSQRRQNQAARKIQQFMRQTKIKLQSARAESAKAALRCQAARRNSSPRTTSTPPMPNRVVNYLSPGTPMNADEDLLLELLFKM